MDTPLFRPLFVKCKDETRVPSTPPLPYCEAKSSQRDPRAENVARFDLWFMNPKDHPTIGAASGGALGLRTNLFTHGKEIDLKPGAFSGTCHTFADRVQTATRTMTVEVNVRNPKLWGL